VWKRALAAGPLGFLLLIAQGGHSPEAQSTSLPDLPTQLRAELDYITSSSWTEGNPNSAGWSWLTLTDDIHGALNDVRIPPNARPDGEGWVEPSIGATAAIGALQAMRTLRERGFDVSSYEAVFDAFFLNWALARRQGQNLDPASADFGAFMTRVSYDSLGNRNGGNPTWKTDTTALMMTAMWKYWEYKLATGQLQQAADWLARAWEIQRRGADYLVRMHDSTPAGAIHLLPGNSTEPHYDAWIHFAGYAVPALRTASAWAQRVGAPHAAYDRVAGQLVTGLQAMKDTSRNIYFRYVPWLGGAYGAPTHGSSIDQLAFVPVETGAVPVDAYAAGISDWFTDGDDQLSMTHPTRDPADWRYFGTHWNWYFAGAPENDRLYPGPGFQLAKLEWRVGVATGAPLYLTRSRKRLEWGRRLAYSALWWFATGEEEAMVTNGFVDWRDGTDYAHTGETWARFIDTSAYFIEVLLMHEAGIDTDHNPQLQDPLPCGSDADEDGICDPDDNCTSASNADQRDSDEDGFGNACDADYDGDGIVGTLDFTKFRRAFGSTAGSRDWDPQLDANGDGAIGTFEFALFRRAFGTPPGPSGLVCAGSMPCP